MCECVNCKLKQAISNTMTTMETEEDKLALTSILCTALQSLYLGAVLQIGLNQTLTIMEVPDGVDNPSLH